MKLGKEWIITIVVLVLALILILSINPKPDCYKECVKKGFVQGNCLDMHQDYRCETKFNYTSMSKELCTQKNYQDHYYACCCQ